VYEDGSLYTWGLGDFGVLGHGTTGSEWSPVKVPLKPTTRANSVSCGSRHTAILTFLGELWICGSGDAGQLGTGRRDSETSFTKVTFAEEISQVSCGIFHTGFVTRSGKAYTMGGNTFGQLGINSKKSS
jgi:alpha-tubulin suppressor-like RCC1 family protein